MIPSLSVLDLAPVTVGHTPGDALRNSRDLAQHAERLGFHRYWLAEHHNMPGIASAATSVVIGYVAEGTSTIRVGAGGIMLPNHAPMMIAEQFGTLESLYPGRIDLGLGRAPGADQATIRALRRAPERADDFPREVQELQAFLAPARPNQAIRAVPGAGLDIPLWILGSSTFGAQLAALLGLPYAFASHFAPDMMLEALAMYRDMFKPSAQLDAPHVMLGAHVIVAETDDEARRLFTTQQQQFANIFRGQTGPAPAPIDDIETYWSPFERERAGQMLKHSFVGAPETVTAGLEAFTALTGADELMITTGVYDHGARRDSYEGLAELAGLQAPAAV
jgi:luciferase family oxidoreductase group 1